MMERVHKQVHKHIAYLEGLLDGLGLDGQSRDGKVLTAIVETLRAVDGSLYRLHRRSEALEERWAGVEETVEEIEEFLFIPEDDEPVPVIEFECPSCQGVFLLKEEAGSGSGAGGASLRCPHCGESFPGVEQSVYGSAYPDSPEGADNGAGMLRPVPLMPKPITKPAGDSGDSGDSGS